MVTKVSHHAVHPVGPVCPQARPSACPSNSPNGEILSTHPSLSAIVHPRAQLSQLKDLRQSSVAGAFPDDDPSVLRLSLVDHGLSRGRGRLSFSPTYFSAFTYPDTCLLLSSICGLVGVHGFPQRLFPSH